MEALKPRVLFLYQALFYQDSLIQFFKAVNCFGEDQELDTDVFKVHYIGFEEFIIQKFNKVFFGFGNQSN